MNVEYLKSLYETGDCFDCIDYLESNLENLLSNPPKLPEEKSKLEEYFEIAKNAYMDCLEWDLVNADKDDSSTFSSLSKFLFLPGAFYNTDYEADLISYITSVWQSFGKVREKAHVSLVSDLIDSPSIDKRTNIVFRESHFSYMVGFLEENVLNSLEAWNKLSEEQQEQITLAADPDAVYIADVDFETANTIYSTVGQRKNKEEKYDAYFVAAFLANNSSDAYKESNHDKYIAALDLSLSAHYHVLLEMESMMKYPASVKSDANEILEKIKKAAPEYKPSFVGVLDREIESAKAEIAKKEEYLSGYPKAKTSLNIKSTVIILVSAFVGFALATAVNASVPLLVGLCTVFGISVCNIISNRGPYKKILVDAAKNKITALNEDVKKLEEMKGNLLK